jgi:hypothetical protein
MKFKLKIQQVQRILLLVPGGVFKQKMLSRARRKRLNAPKCSAGLGF